MLAINTSNRCIDLQTVIGNLAVSFGKEMLVVSDDGDDHLIYGSTFALVSARGGLLDQPDLKSAGEKFDLKTNKGYVWTDDYSGVWRVLKGFRGQ